MKYVVPIAVLGILLLQASGGIPNDGVGGSLMIALALFLGGLAVGVYEAVARRRGVLGWIVNIAVSLVGVFVVAPTGSMLVALLLGPFMDGSSSLASAGGPVMYAALAGMMIVTQLGIWGALWLVNRWR